MFLIHLPALTFDPNIPQFSQSLEACVHSSRNIIDILNKNRSERRLFYLQPNGARLIFQSALMCLYESWLAKSSKEQKHASEQNVNQEGFLIDKINCATALLQMQATECLKTDLSGLEGQSWMSSEIYQTAISTLKKLAAQTTPIDNSSTADVVAISDSPIRETSQHELAPPSSAVESWRLSALDGLNQLDLVEWDFDPTPAEHNVMDSNFLDASMLL
jgi:hypothetical protein